MLSAQFSSVDYDCARSCWQQCLAAQDTVINSFSDGNNNQDMGELPRNHHPERTREERRTRSERQSTHTIHKENNTRRTLWHRQRTDKRRASSERRGEKGMEEGITYFFDSYALIAQTFEAYFKELWGKSVPFMKAWEVEQGFLLTQNTENK